VEVLQQNLPTKTREYVFALSFVLGFLVSGTLGVSLGFLLDANPQSLRILLCGFSLIGLSNLIFLKQIPITQSIEKKAYFMTALKESWCLVQKFPDFRIFQIVFMIGGGALMLISPSLSLYYVDVLALSHTQITMARFVFMALGVIGSSFFWKKGLQRFHLNMLSIGILLGFGAFALCMLIAQKSLFFLFAAFVFYGIAQSGSHLIWNLSGPIFAGGNGSIPYTSVNLLMIGIRGLIFPFLGGSLASALDAQIVIGIGMLICFLGALNVYSRSTSIAPKKTALKALYNRIKNRGSY
jgi:hypothetical protein